MQQITAEGIAHNSYFIGSAGEAAVIDPRRDYEVYVDLAKKHKMTINYILETHRNEDYTIGSLDLARATGADIFHGSQLRFSYGSPVKENDTFTIGLLELSIVETPGHTDESISIRVRDKTKNAEPVMIFTGDLLFSGDTGRTDLYGEKEKKRLAETLYEPLHNKILPLGDGVIVYPAHGKGSVCGGEISDLAYTTIGYEKEHNPQLSFTKDDFVQYKIKEHHYIPPYFKQMERYNQNGAPLIYTIPVLDVFSAESVKTMQKNGAQLVDIRSPTSFASGHIPGSLSIWRKGLPLFAGWFLTYEKPIVLIDDFNLDLEEVMRSLLRLGYDNISGHLKGGFSSWYKENQPMETISTWTVAELQNHRNDDAIFLLDVREKPDRSKQGHIKNSTNIYVGNLPHSVSTIPQKKQVVVYCDSGFKTSIACSILKQKGYSDVTNVLGGFMAWKKAGYQIET